jgi:hypothetical protein
MKIIAQFVIITAGLWAQAPVPQFQDTHLTGGIQYTNSGPHFTGWVGMAKLVSPAAGTYSFTGSYITPKTDSVSKKINLTTSYTTGGAQHLRDLGPVRLFVLGGLGASMGSSFTALNTTTIGLALNAGVFVVIPLRGGFSLDVMGQSLKAAGVNSTIVGLGFGWGK